MDKYDIVLDLIEHPAEYTPERIAEILSDPETREIYNLLCKTGSTFASQDAEVDVNDEWQSFSKSHKKPKFRFFWSGSRAASITAIAFTSLTVVAIGITVAVKTFAPQSQPLETMSETSVTTSVYVSETVENDSTAVAEEVVLPNTPILFDDASLEGILNRVADVHGVSVEYKKPEVALLHLYYRFDPAIPLKETIEQLNSFEQINIRINGKKIIVD